MNHIFAMDEVEVANAISVFDKKAAEARKTQALVFTAKVHGDLLAELEMFKQTPSKAHRRYQPTTASRLAYKTLFW